MCNRGSAAVEATLVFPLFLFFVMSLYHMCCSRLADNYIYEAAVETAEYMAEYAYLDGNNFLIPSYMFEGYVDSEEIVERYVSGGVDGVSFIGSVPLDDAGYITLCVRYRLAIQLPFLPKLTIDRNYSIRQKAYVGADYNVDEDDTENDDCYVYVTDNRDVYHSTRACTYLILSIQSSDISAAIRGGYTACEICGHNTGDRVYITDYGDRYHSEPGCSGLKRTVYRVKMADVDGLGGCTRCVRE